MYNCLVTKLKEVVNDNTLPVFVNVDDYEEYINASGNTSMTNDQKMAVAMFFASIGAKSVGGIFSKIKYLFIPMLSADLAHSLVNYVSNTAITPATGVTFANHGIYATTLVNQELTCSNWGANNFSTFWMRSGDMSSNSARFAAAAFLDNSDNSHVVHFFERSGDIIAFLGTSESTPFAFLSHVERGKGKLKGFTVSDGDVFALNGEYSKVETDQSSLSGTITAKIRVFAYSSMNQIADYPGSMLIISDALTTEEVAILKNASERLAQAFLVDEAS